MTHSLSFKIKTQICIQPRYNAWMPRSKQHAAFGYDPRHSRQDQPLLLLISNFWVSTQWSFPPSTWSVRGIRCKDCGRHWKPICLTVQTQYLGIYYTAYSEGNIMLYVVNDYLNYPPFLWSIFRCLTWRWSCTHTCASFAITEARHSVTLDTMAIRHR